VGNSNEEYGTFGNIGKIRRLFDPLTDSHALSFFRFTE
jgi:hypothetical protein